MNDKKAIEIVKTNNKKIASLQYTKAIITGEVARAFTSYDNQIKPHSLWRAVHKNELAKTAYKNYCMARSLPFVLKNVYYRTDPQCTAYEFKKIERNKTKTRKENKRSLFRSIKIAKDKINSNIDPYTLFITLTYTQNQTSTGRLYIDHNLFIKKLVNHLAKEHDYKNPRWFTAKEPQERGAWHLHILLFSPYTEKIDDNGKITRLYKKIFLDNDTEIFELWNNCKLTQEMKDGKINPPMGYTKTQRIKKKENAGNYITSYLTNLEPETGDGQKEKKNKKNKRLDLYPSNFKMFSNSRNLFKSIITDPQPHGFTVNELESLGFKIADYHPKNGYQIISNTTGELLKEYNYENYKKGE